MSVRVHTCRPLSQFPLSLLQPSTFVPSVVFMLCVLFFVRGMRRHVWAQPCCDLGPNYTTYALPWPVPEPGHFRMGQLSLQQQASVVTGSGDPDIQALYVTEQAYRFKSLLLTAWGPLLACAPLYSHASSASGLCCFCLSHTFSCVPITATVASRAGSYSTQIVALQCGRRHTHPTPWPPANSHCLQRHVTDCPAPPACPQLCVQLHGPRCCS